MTPEQYQQHVLGLLETTFPDELYEGSPDPFLIKHGKAELGLRNLYVLHTEKQTAPEERDAQTWAQETTGSNFRCGTKCGTITTMTIEEAIRELETNESHIRFSRLLVICGQFFGKSRIVGSHHIFKTPWTGDPRINLQQDKGTAKPYQVRQVLRCLRRLKDQAVS